MNNLMDPRYLVKLAIETALDPSGGAREILRLALPRPALILAFALMVVASLIIGEVLVLLLGVPDVGPLNGLPVLFLGLIQAAFLFLIVLAITHIGRAFGGTGEFDGALALITWLQFVFFLVQLVQLVLMIIAPPLAAIAMILAIGLFFWLLISFIAVLHNFESKSMVFVMTLVSFISIIFVLSIVLAILGVSVDPGGIS